eukprot:scaffold25556_cov70-Phaeocystis_antarctica.AAC.20
MPYCSTDEWPSSMYKRPPSLSSMRPYRRIRGTKGSSQTFRSWTNLLLACSAYGGRGGNTDLEAVGRVEGARKVPGRGRARARGSGRGWGPRALAGRRLDATWRRREDTLRFHPRFGQDAWARQTPPEHQFHMPKR